MSSKPSVSRIRSYEAKRRASSLNQDGAIGLFVGHYSSEVRDTALHLSCLTRVGGKAVLAIRAGPAPSPSGPGSEPLHAGPSHAGQAALRTFVTASASQASAGMRPSLSDLKPRLSTWTDSGTKWALNRRPGGVMSIGGGELSAEPDDWDVVIPTDDAAITRRRRALAPIQVLTDIERTKSSLDGDFWQRYDLFNIALGVIDQVALAMGISAGRGWDETLEYAIGQAARQVPGAQRSEWVSVAERVLVSLVTTDMKVVPYLVHTESGPAWRAQRFRLLYVHAGGSDGAEYLRASEQAINIFVEALDLDIEAAQIANEAQLAALIKRDAVESAVQIARHARYRSIQYQERIRRIVADTLIDPDVHDWLGEVPELLEAALGHVRDRLEAEAALLDAVAERRAELKDAGRVEAANQLVVILRECRHRHDELHGHLIGARARLREALDDRFVRPPRSVHRADLTSDLLDPYLALPVREVGEATGRMVAMLGGVGVRFWPWLSVLTDELCAPSRPPDPGETFVESEVNSADWPEWWQAYEDTTDAVFAAIEQPIRLSALLARVDELAATTVDVEGRPLDPGLLAASIVHSGHRAWAARLAGLAAEERVVLAVPTGDEIDTPRVRSPDLLLVDGVVTADIAQSTVSELKAARFDAHIAFAADGAGESQEATG